MEKINKPPFEASISTRDGILITREGNNALSVAPADIDSFIKLITVVMGVESLTLLPGLLRNGPFEARFSKDRTITVDREDAQQTGLRFSFTEGDDLIWLAKQALNKFIDIQTIQGPTKAFVKSTPEAPW